MRRASGNRAGLVRGGGPLFKAPGRCGGPRSALSSPATGGTMPEFGKEEIANLTAVIESGTFCDKRGGFMGRFREEFAHALGAKHALTGGAATLLMHAIPGAMLVSIHAPARGAT